MKIQLVILVLITLVEAGQSRKFTRINGKRSSSHDKNVAGARELNPLLRTSKRSSSHDKNVADARELNPLLRTGKRSSSHDKNVVGARELNPLLRTSKQSSSHGKNVAGARELNPLLRTGKRSSSHDKNVAGTRKIKSKNKSKESLKDNTSNNIKEKDKRSSSHDKNVAGARELNPLLRTYVCTTENCVNGHCDNDNDNCECHIGWTGQNCNTPVCDPDCINGGTCTAVNRCTCPNIYIGNYCQTRQPSRRKSLEDIANSLKTDIADSVKKTDASISSIMEVLNIANSLNTDIADSLKKTEASISSIMEVLTRCSATTCENGYCTETSCECKKGWKGKHCNIDNRCLDGFVVSTQCFHFFNEEVPWEVAGEICNSHDFILAEVLDENAMGLQEIMGTVSPYTHWLNARGDDEENVLWQHSQTVLSTNNNLWAPYDTVYVTSNYCLAIHVAWAAPYKTRLCSSFNAIVCEDTRYVHESNLD